MANNYTDHPELRFELNHPLMKRIVELKERNFRDKETYDYAPLDFEDTMDSYERVLDIVGDIAGTTVADNAEGVDLEGPHHEGDRVRYASGTEKNMEAMVKAGMNGMTMPRRFGGLNFAITPYTMCAELVAASDPGFSNIWSLQDCIETLYEFGNEDQHSRFIPLVCEGATMSMDLTEPDAGSDLQRVMLKATYSEKDGCWLLNGVKRFITNGDADIHLVLARSEEGTTDGRGLSMFIYDKRQGGVNVRRIENKLGIHGSPTCELVYKNAHAELCGDRKLGLIKYVMALMNGARLGIAAQSVGISQAAYNEGLAYAADRQQFGKPIIEFPAVYDMLALMKAKLDAGRALLYQCSRYVDLYKALEDIGRERKLEADERKEQKEYAKLADSLTPLAKGINSEYANQNTYDSIQIHGGSGFMLDYPIQRFYRDARITSIYEGTTQLQVVAAIRYVTNGSYLKQMRDFEQAEVSEALRPIQERARAMADTFAAAVDHVKAMESQEALDFCARHLVEIAANVIMLHLLLHNATEAPELFDNSVRVYANFVEAEIAKHNTFILNTTVEQLEAYRQHLPENEQ
ncbi:Acyl-CoA dehydrogenase C-terminal domain-containing protein [Alloprevotella tannerae]|jgi:acyl-coA dehydrogenase family protein|uniref:acyl-CoA dehydrogenase family protein n=1 Tax=Alloprevotella tannerae TaxID=76122 RepID=UPI0028ED276F|nr:Acyl-CoA dehydrogenase C-terminal domain-containing protein [Alloprevotella tannerae]